MPPSSKSVRAPAASPAVGVCAALKPSRGGSASFAAARKGARSVRNSSPGLPSGAPTAGGEVVVEPLEAAWACADEKGEEGERGGVLRSTRV
jgi:hypothetical protein